MSMFIVGLLVGLLVGAVIGHVALRDALSKDGFETVYDASKTPGRGRWVVKRKKMEML